MVQMNTFLRQAACNGPRELLVPTHNFAASLHRPRIFLFFLDLISFGIFTYALGVAGAIVLLGFVHYLAWGRSMSEEFAAEREAMVLKEEKEAEDREHPEGIQDLTRTKGIKRGRPGR